VSTSTKLLVKPRACDHCGRCLKACPLGALRVGRSYIMVDWARCDSCGRCAAVCRTGAIRVTGAAATPRARSSAAAPALRKRNVPVRETGPFAWTLLEAVATLSVTFSAFMAKEAVLASPAILALPTAQLVPLRVGVLAIYYALQVALLWWLVYRRGADFLDAFQLRDVGEGVGRSIWLVVVGLLGTRALATAYGLLTRQLGLTPDAGTSTVTRVFGTAPAGLVLAVVMLVFVGPFVEELVFRGALLRGLESRLGPWPAIVIQALLFAAFHRSWWLLAPMTVLGVALGWLAHERRSLWPSVAVHAFYNGLSVLAVLATVLVSR